MSPRRITLCVQPPVALGDMALVPEPLSGRPEADLARAMAAVLAEVDEPPASEIYCRLHQAFPFVPLGARIQALGKLMTRSICC